MVLTWGRGVGYAWGAMNTPQHPPTKKISHRDAVKAAARMVAHVEKSLSGMTESKAKASGLASLREASLDALEYLTHNPPVK